MITHRWANIAVAASLWAAALRAPGAALLAVALTALSVDALIDKLGHERGHFGPKRSTRTHTVLTAPVFGASVGAILGAVAAYVVGTMSGVGFMAYAPLLPAAGAAEGALAGLVHLLLDSVTEHGIYVGGHRWRLLGWRSDDPGANGLVVMLSVLAFGLALVVRWPQLLGYAESLAASVPVLRLAAPAFLLAVGIAAVGAFRTRNTVPMASRKRKAAPAPSVTKVPVPAARPAPIAETESDPEEARVVRCHRCGSSVPRLYCCDQCGTPLRLASVLPVAPLPALLREARQ